MATLLDETASDPTFSLQITPDTPVPGGPYDAYRLILREGEAVQFSGHCRGHRYGMGHYYLTRIAEAFINARRLFNASVSLMNCFGEEQPNQCFVREGMGNVELFLGTFETENGRWVEVHLFVRPDWDRPLDDMLLTPYLSVFMRCSAEAAEAFGNELYEEVRAAEELSDALQEP